MLLHFAVLPIAAVVALRITLLFSRYSGNRLEKLSRDREGQSASGSTISGASAFAGAGAMRMMWRLPTTARRFSSGAEAADHSSR